MRGREADLKRLKTETPGLGLPPPAYHLVAVGFLKVLVVFFDRNPKKGHGGELTL